MIKFITKCSGELPPRFSEVEANQFFINGFGELCQKLRGKEYNIIADKCGVPLSERVDVRCEQQFIQKILPAVAKIEF